MLIDYNLGFARECLKMGKLAGEVGATVHYQGRRGHAKHWPWQVYKGGNNGFSQTYKTAEEVVAFLDGYKKKLAAG